MLGDTEITNSENTIDSRDVIARIEYLNPWKVEDKRTAYVEEFKTQEEAQGYIDEQPEDERGHLVAVEYTDEAEELKALQDLAQEGEDNAEDWQYGATLIHEDYFETYAEEYASDLRDYDEAQWPFMHIDWAAAADHLKMDYSEVEFDGQTYYVR